MSILQLSLQAELAIATLVIVAEAEGNRVTTQEVARAIGIKTMHAAKVVHTLGRAGLLVAQRGRGGGLKLVRTSSLISLNDPIAAVDATSRAPSREKITPLSAALDEVSNYAAAEVGRLFAAFTIRDLVEKRKDPKGKAITRTKRPCRRKNCPYSAAITAPIENSGLE